MLLVFATHLQQVKNVNIWTLPPYDVNDVERKQGEASMMVSVMSKMSRFWQFVEKLKGNRSNLVGVAHFDLVDKTTSRRRDFHSNLRKFKITSNKQVELRYCFDCQALFSMLRSLLQPEHQQLQSLDFRVESGALPERNTLQMLRFVFDNFFRSIREIWMHMRVRGSSNASIGFCDIVDKENTSS